MGVGGGVVGGGGWGVSSGFRVWIFAGAWAEAQMGQGTANIEFDASRKHPEEWREARA